MRTSLRAAALLGSAALLATLTAGTASAQSLDANGLTGSVQGLDVSSLAGAPSESFKQGVVAEANRVRAEKHLPALRVDPAISGVAQAWTDHVARTLPSPFMITPENAHNQQVGAQIPKGATAGPAEICGYSSTATPQAIVEGWMTSTDGHREALLDARYTTVGIGASNLLLPPGPYVCMDLVRY